MSEKWNGRMGKMPRKNATWIEWIPDEWINNHSPSELVALWERKHREAVEHLELLPETNTVLEKAMKTGKGSFSRFHDPTSWLNWAIVNFILNRERNVTRDVGLRPLCSPDSTTDEIVYVKHGEMCDNAQVECLAGDSVQDVVQSKFEDLRVAESMLVNSIHKEYFARAAQNYLRALLSFLDSDAVFERMHFGSRVAINEMIGRVRGIVDKSESCARQEDQFLSVPMILILAGCVQLSADMRLGSQRYRGRNELLSRGIALPIKAADSLSIRVTYYRNICKVLEEALEKEILEVSEPLIDLIGELTRNDSSIAADFEAALLQRKFGRAASKFNHLSYNFQ